jgi:CDGSH-type Zn-finger protein
MNGPGIDVAEKGPFLVKGSVLYTDAEGNEIVTEKDAVALCRCGASKNKPFCDGTHSDIGFTGEKVRTETYPTQEFEGDELTVVDNIGVCCHAGACVTGVPDVVFEWDGDERISVPEADDIEKIIDVIRQCPSGSLVYKLNGELQDEYFSDPEIFVSEDGPLHVRGGIMFNDKDQPVTISHYTFAAAERPRISRFAMARTGRRGLKGRG